ncbi:GNAT family N-acetyltransferase [Hanstruepera marina]|uniref:GNAT family N-acetyltransferase n=1 Tax=Hanstruepera marina TaxID=2873265 RepID=UPI001CA7377E|nr:GNAT family N-acetyltransferase [Hanstruepera marina]
MDYHKDRFQDASVMVFKNDRVVALFPANQVDQTIYSHQGLTYGGLILNSKLKLQAVIEIFKLVLEYYQSQGFIDLEIKIMPNIYSDLPSDELLYLTFLLDAKLIKRDTLSVIKLDNRLKYNKDRNDGVKRAEKHNLTIKEDDVFDVFWNDILIPNLLDKHNVSPVHSLEEIKLLKQHFPNNIKQYNVYHGNKVVAGTTIFITKHVAHSQYISANTDKNSLGSLDFLHNHLLNGVFKDKRYFDFGISNEDQGRKINLGLQYWKEGFGARTVVQDFYTIPIANFKMLDNVLS